MCWKSTDNHSGPSQQAHHVGDFPFVLHISYGSIICSDPAMNIKTAALCKTLDKSRCSDQDVYISRFDEVEC